MSCYGAAQPECSMTFHGGAAQSMRACSLLRLVLLAPCVGARSLRGRQRHQDWRRPAAPVPS